MITVYNQSIQSNDEGHRLCVIVKDPTRGKKKKKKKKRETLPSNLLNKEKESTQRVMLVKHLLKTKNSPLR